MDTVNVFLKFFASLQLSAQIQLLQIIQAEVLASGTRTTVHQEALSYGSLLEHVLRMNGLVVYSAPVDDYTKALAVYELADGKVEGLRVLDCRLQLTTRCHELWVADGPMKQLVAEHGQALLQLMSRLMLEKHADSFT